MKIIENIEALQRLMTNTVETVEGEINIFDRLKPYLESAEQWTVDAFTGECIDAIAADTASPVWVHTAMLIYSEAMRLAIPSLDLVLTPNGFGVVSTANVAPASKDRVERLIKSFVAERNKNIDLLIRDLSASPDWQDTAQFQRLTESLVSIPSDCVTAVYGMDKRLQEWEIFKQLRERSMVIERAIAERWIDEGTLAILRKAVLVKNDDEHIDAVAKWTRACVLKELRTSLRDRWELDQIVDYIRKHPDSFPVWMASPVRELYDNPPIFRNEKKSSGYIF